MTADQAKEILTLLIASFPHANSNIDPAVALTRASLYERDLASMHYETMLEAVESIRFSCKFFPSMAEIREHYRASHPPESTRDPSLFPALPDRGNTIATPEQVRAACRKVYEMLGVDMLKGGPLADPNIGAPTREPGDDQDEADRRYDFEERAAIMEFDGGLPRAEAERQARETKR